MDRSFMVRDSIERYLASGSADTETKIPAASPILPPSIFMLTPPYRGLGRDLRVELWDGLRRLVVSGKRATYPAWPRHVDRSDFSVMDSSEANRFGRSALRWEVSNFPAVILRSGLFSLLADA